MNSKDIHGKSRETFIMFTTLKKHSKKKAQSRETLRSGVKSLKVTKNTLAIPAWFLMPQDKLSL